MTTHEPPHTSGLPSVVGVHPIDHADILGAVRCLEQERTELLDILHKQREATREKLAELDKAIATLEGRAALLRPSAGQNAKGGAAVPDGEVCQRSFPLLVEDLIRRNPGVTTPTIIERVKAVRGSDVDVRNIHTALYRLGQADRIRHTGKRGSMKYFIHPSNSGCIISNRVLAPRK